MIKHAVYALAVFLLAVSCAGFTSAPDGTPAAEKPDTAGASTLEEIFDSGHWITKPSGSVITIIGIAGRKPDRSAAIADAIADAARKAALYHGVYAESAAVLNQGSGSLDYYSDFGYRIEPENGYENYTGALDFDEETDVLEKNGVVIVRARYTADIPDEPVYCAAPVGGVPVWVKNYAAEIPGFLVGVGYSKNKGARQKTYQASYEAAIISILPSLSTKFSGEVIDVKNGRLTSGITVSRGGLINIMILETWFDKKTNSAWTLLAAREKK
jgi:hypothetical protein